MRFRISIARLIAAIAFIGVGIAALRSATDLWASSIFTATLLGFALTAAYAAQRRGPRRAFWSAFVSFGVGYIVLAFGPWCESSIRPRLLTTKVLDALYPLAATEPESAVGVWDSATGRRVASFSPDGLYFAIPNPGSAVRIWGPDATRQARFQTIGHSLFALLLAAIGGTVSSYFYANRDERRREAAERAAGVLLKVLEAGL